MAKERIGKTLIVLSEDEVCQIVALAQAADQQAILEFVRDVIARKVEAALRKRCR
jgi:hypothetical protein